MGGFPSSSVTTGKYWLKRARIPLARLEGAPPGALCDGEGFCLCDVRIEGGEIRAVLAAGGAPCCCRGIDLDGARVCPISPDARIVPGQTADLLIDGGPGCRVRLLRGVVDDSAPYSVACVCTPAPPKTTC